MKKLILIISTIIFTSCRTGTFHEYKVVNNSSRKIIVEVTTYGGEYKKFLSYEINPNDWEYIFEHRDLQGMNQNKDNFLKFIKSVEIYSIPDKITIIKKFTSDNMKISTKDGLFGHYINYDFEVSEDDFR